MRITKYFSKILLILFCFANSFVVFGQEDPQLTLLTKAYKKKSDKLMKEFLENWEKEVSPITEEERLQIIHSFENDTITEAHQIVSQFKEYMLNYNLSTEFKIMVKDTSNNKLITTYTIPNYFTYHISHYYPLFLNEKYKSILKLFLQCTGDGRCNYEETPKRKRFLLDHKIYLEGTRRCGCVPNHHLTLIFSNDLQSAHILCWYCSNSLILTKTDNYWRITEIRKESIIVHD